MKFIVGIWSCGAYHTVCEIQFWLQLYYVYCNMNFILLLIITK